MQELIFGSKSSKYLDSRKIFALVALVAAIIAARGAGNYLAYAGVTYYIICIIAILVNFRWTACLLWAAVGAHVLLTGYAIWSWHTEMIIPCHYCLWAAGFVLLAATAFYRSSVAVLPVLLMVGVWAAWPNFFGDKVLDEISRPAGEVTVQPAAAPAGETPGDADKTLPAGETPAGDLPRMDSAAGNPAAAKPSQAAGPGPTEPGPTASEPPQSKPETAVPGVAPAQPADAVSTPPPDQGSAPAQPGNQPDPGAAAPAEQPQVAPDNSGPVKPAAEEPDVEPVEEPVDDPADDKEDEPKKPTSG